MISHYNLKGFGILQLCNYFLLCLGAMFALVSCGIDNLDLALEHNFALEIRSVSINGQAKVLVNDQIGSGESIGLFVYDGASSSYMGSNVKFTANGSGLSQDWTTANPLLLGIDPVIVYAYYPYNTGISDITNVPLSIEQQIDFLYATPKSGINQNSKRVSLVMNHALTVVRFRIRKSADSNCSKLNRTLIVSQSFCNQGVLNCTNGLISSTSTADGQIAKMLNMTLLTDYQEVDFLVIPNGKTSVLNAAFVVDNSTFNTSLGSIKLEQGKLYTYDFTITHGSLGFDGLSVTPWISETGQEGDLIADSHYETEISFVDINGKEVYAPTRDCIGVVLTTDKERLMIEKYEDENPSYQQILNGFNVTSESGYCYWGYGLKTVNEVLGITAYRSYNYASDPYCYGYIPDKNGNYYTEPGSKYLEYGLPSSWPNSNYALADRSGYEESNYLNQVTVTDNYNSYPRMRQVLNAFLASDDALGYNDWFIPSCRQLALMCVYKNDINKALVAIGGTPIYEQCYWSTSEDDGSGWNIRFDIGYICSHFKTSVFRVRFVRKF